MVEYTRKERVLAFVALLLFAIFSMILGGEYGLIFGLSIVFILLVVVIYTLTHTETNQ